MWKRLLVAAAMGAFPFPFCFCLAEVGHGAYLPVWLFYGPTFLLAEHVPEAVLLVSMGVLYPLYASVLFAARKRGYAVYVLFGVFLIHYACVACGVGYREDWGMAARAASRQWFSVLATVSLAVTFHVVAILYASGRIERLCNPTVRSAVVAVSLAAFTAGAFLALYWSAVAYHRAGYPAGKTGEKSPGKAAGRTAPASCIPPDTKTAVP